MSTLILWLGARDERLLIAVVSRRRRFLDLCFRWITHLADPVVAIGVTGALAVGLLPRLHSIGIHAASTLVLSHLLVEVVKRSVVRPRPSLPVGLESLVQPPDRFSFPSGHAAAALAMAIPASVGLGVPLGPLALLLGLAVGVSRCYLGVHYPGDVMAGWLIASLSAVAITVGLR